MFDVLRICSTFFCGYLWLLVAIRGYSWLLVAIRGYLWLSVAICAYSITLHTLYNITDIRVFEAVPTHYRYYRASQILEICKQM